jgi:hypothetical protein
MTDMKKVSVLVTVVCLGWMAICGCYGPFRLTKKVYDWNGSLPDPWGREAMFLVLNILPVYGFSVFADAVFFNLVEFWGGENLLASGDTRPRYIAKGKQQAVLTFSRDRDRVRIDLFNNHRPANCLFLESAKGGGMIARDASGGVVMTARMLHDGSVFVADGQGKEVACHIPEEAQ